MMHWFHTITNRGRHLAAYAADELPEVERARTEAALTACPACRREAEAYRRLSGALRTAPRVALAPDQAAAFWAGVERRLQGGADPADIRPARPSLREVFRDHPRLSLASAAAAVVLVLGLTLAQMDLWGPHPPVALNGVDVVSVEAGGEASVMVFQAPGSSLKVIWVFEKSPS